MEDAKPTLGWEPLLENCRVALLEKITWVKPTKTYRQAFEDHDVKSPASALTVLIGVF